MDDPSGLADRIAALEARVAKLETPDALSPRLAADATVLDWLRTEAPEGGGVAFAGTLALPGGRRVEWQMGHPASGLLEADWRDIAPALAALGHPVRLLLLNAVLAGTQETAALAEILGDGTTGQLHHHLRELTAAGWLRAERRGRYDIPADRVVPLLVAIAAAGGPQTGQVRQ
ncbi:ArsR/SmtB family transcription factor [Histidinibacterium lentulum]|uniref:ArsR family transcriptional regulator n=1 Tax=Histidinibacterium lentulum TaxID=2480588 RepID=A0A3N2R9S5_9RHOB|nr:winged helix-turn-helix domain-containing protein [Histidinibacterium lentulum]ROU04096.1 ArsR family transcriptional regulator [Histidinibacterium lentulum]